MRKKGTKISKIYKRQKTKFLDNWEFWYKSCFCFLLVMYPHLVSDGQGWKYYPEYGTSLPEIYKIHGIDISWHNGTIEWEKLNNNREDREIIEFIFIKATEGTDLVDSQFKKNWEGAKESGYKRGAYHFFNPISDPRLQALNFIVNTNFEKGDLYPVLDFEVNGKTDAQKNKAFENAKIWLDIVEKKVGVKPIVYTNKPIFRDFIKENLIGYPIWISDYVSKDVSSVQDANIVIWQHTDTGKVNGINGKVDFNVFMGTPLKFEQIIL